MEPREAMTKVRINIRGTVGSRRQLKAAELNSLSRFDDSLLGLWVRSFHSMSHILSPALSLLKVTLALSLSSHICFQYSVNSRIMSVLAAAVWLFLLKSGTLYKTEAQISPQRKIFKMMEHKNGWNTNWECHACIDVSEVADGNLKVTLKVWTQRKVAENLKKQQFWGFAKDVYYVAEMIT